MTPLIALLSDVALFAAFVVLVGAACAPPPIPDQRLRFVTGIALALGGAFILGFLGFAFHVGNARTALVAAVSSAAVVLLRRERVAMLLRDRAVRELIATWLVFAGWSLGLLALVVTYSGGGWVADWVEHWQRTLFFVERQPLATRFALIYSLPARPPLANLLIAQLLAASGATFAHYQVFLCLFGSLAILPAAVLAQRWTSRPAASRWLLLLAMANPMLAQNLTFAWTKLPTAFFVLTALALALTSLPGTPSTGSRFAAVVVLALAMLTHYSAGPWIIALAVGWLICWRNRWGESAFWRDAALLAGVFVAIVGIWVGWSATAYGWGQTVASNSTAAEWHSQSTAERLLTPVWNMVDTLVPFPLRGAPADGLIEQASALGRARDVAFNLYQVNLPFALGFSALAVLAFALVHRRRAVAARPNSPNPERLFLLITLPLVTVLGIVVHTPRDQWGLAHICLQPLVLAALARAAAELPALPVSLRWVWAACAAVDVAFGIVLQFGIESWAFAPWISPGAPSWTLLTQLSRSAAANANDKWAFHLQFLSDQLHTSVALIALWLALCAGYAILRTRRATPVPL